MVPGRSQVSQGSAPKSCFAAVASFLTKYYGVSCCYDVKLKV